MTHISNFFFERNEIRMALPVYYYYTTILFNVIFYSVLFKMFENVINLTMQEILFLATFPLYCLAATSNITLKSLGEMFDTS